MDKPGKPPLGVKPAWMVAWSRIGDLAEAIKRQCESHYVNARLVDEWAKEIGWQCSIIESFKDEEAYHVSE